MQAPARLLALVVLAFLGLGVSLYQTSHFHELRGGSQGFSTFCSVGEAFDCQAVEASPYAEVMGVPISAVGSAGFLLIALLGLIARNAYWRRDALRALLLATGFGTLVSLTYLGIMVGLVGKLCMLCLTLDACMLACLGITVSLKPEGLTPHGPDVKKWRSFALIGVASLLGNLFVNAQMQPSSIYGDDEVMVMVNQLINSNPIPVNVPSYSPTIGPENAPITVVKFSDFQCPACKRGALGLHPALFKYSDKVRFVYRAFPLDSKCNPAIKRQMHPAACEMARAAFCAHKQGRFKEVYEHIFEHQADLKPGFAMKAALDLNLDGQAMEACLNSAEVRDYIARDLQEGDALGVASTPTFYVNGRKVKGFFNAKYWDLLIPRLLEQ